MGTSTRCVCPPSVVIFFCRQFRLGRQGGEERARREGIFNFQKIPSSFTTNHEVIVQGGEGEFQSFKLPPLALVISLNLIYIVIQSSLLEIFYGYTLHSRSNKKKPRCVLSEITCCLLFKEAVCSNFKRPGNIYAM